MIIEYYNKYNYSYIIIGTNKGTVNEVNPDEPAKLVYNRTNVLRKAIYIIIDTDW